VLNDTSDNSGHLVNKIFTHKTYIPIISAQNSSILPPNSPQILLSATSYAFLDKNFPKKEIYWLSSYSK